MDLKARWPKNITDKRFSFFPRMIATSLGVGYLPFAPGTWGAILGVLLWLPLYLWASPALDFIVTLLAIIIIGIAGTWASNESEKYWGKDPVVACVDETVGQWVSMLPLCMGVHIVPWWEIIVSLILFRLFDIFKPLGIRRLENLPGGWGMMADDIAAGLLTAMIMILINLFTLP